MKQALPFLATVLAAISLVQAQEVAPSPAPTTDYEELPELKASEILREDILNGPYHKVREEVTRTREPTATRLTRTSVFSRRKETRCSSGESARLTRSRN